MTADNEDRYIIEAADAALHVLTTVAENPGLTLAEIAQIANLNKSRTMRLLVTLKKHDFVSRNQDNRFSLGLKALLCGNTARDHLDIPTIVQPELDGLRDKTGETVQYRVLSGTRSFCVAKADTRHSVGIQTQLGRPRDLHVGSAKALLAFGSESLIEKVLSLPLEQYTSQTKTNREELLAELELIRQAGYAISRSERVEGVLAIGVPIFNADDSVTSSLSLTAPRERIEKHIEKLIPLVFETAQAISIRFGWNSRNRSTGFYQL